MKYFIGFIIFVTTTTIALSQQIQIRDRRSITPSSVAKPLVVLDDIVLPSFVRSKIDTTKLVDPLTEIDSNDIDEMTILKNDNATALYGDAGKNGALIITTKTYSKKPNEQ